MAELNDTFTDFGIQQGAKYLNYNKNKVSTVDGGRIASSNSEAPRGVLSRFGKCGPGRNASNIECFTGKISKYGSCPLNVNTNVEGFVPNTSSYGKCNLNVNNNIEGFAGHTASYGKCNLNVTHTIEGFTGAFGESEANIRNQQQGQEITQIRDQFDRAKSQYANAQKTLMSETSMFINNSSDSGPGAEYRNKFVKLSDGSLAFITDRNVIMPVDPVVYEANKGKNGCDPTIVTVPFGPEEGAPPGVLRKADAQPNFFIGQPLKVGQSCAPTNVNLQVLGATDPDTNVRSWLGCRTGDFSNLASEQQDISSLTQTADQALERCRIRAADVGASAFAIGPSSYGGSYGCFIANNGVTADQITDNTKLGTIQKISNTLQTANGGGLSAAVFYNGQVGMADMRGNIRKAQNVQMWSNSSAFDNCDPQTGATIDVVSATYGANCNGQINPIAAAQKAAMEAAKQQALNALKTVI